MSWRRFTTLLAGLSPSALYRLLASQGGKPRPLTARDAPAFFARFRKVGET
ncbi:MAG: hypothetical protein QM323_11775 [Acidobacteriota bacterium]|jgi:hypothetical protein|nr:hypothetical protein [Acidobacteriota bacterium]